MCACLIVKYLVHRCERTGVPPAPAPENMRNNGVVAQSTAVQCCSPPKSSNMRARHTSAAEAAAAAINVVIGIVVIALPSLFTHCARTRRQLPAPCDIIRAHADAAVARSPSTHTHVNTREHADYDRLHTTNNQKKKKTMRVQGGDYDRCCRCCCCCCAVLSRYN